MRIILGPEPEQNQPSSKKSEETVSVSASAASVPVLRDIRQGWTQEVHQQTAVLEGDLHLRADGLAQTVAQQMQTLMHSTQRWEDTQRRQLTFSVENLKTEWHQELQSLEKMFHTEREQWAAQLKEKDVAIEKLLAELEETRKLMQTQVIRSSSAQAVPVTEENQYLDLDVVPANFDPLPSVVSVPPAPAATPVIPVDEFVLPPSDPPSKKVAFLSKLWNYLNQSAIEIPRRNRD